MQEGQNRKTSSLSILAIAGVEPYQEKPGEEYMNEAQLAHFRRILEAWRNQLRDEVDRTVTHMQDEAAHENAKAFHDKCENKDLRVCGRG